MPDRPHETALTTAVIKTTAAIQPEILDVMGKPIRGAVDNIPPSLWQKVQDELTRSVRNPLAIIFGYAAHRLLKWLVGRTDYAPEDADEIIAIAADQYAERRALALFDGWVDHTRNRLRELVDRAESEEWTRRQFDEEAKPIFGEDRGKVIGVTETTGGSTGGTRFIETDFNQERPDEHVLLIWRHRKKLEKGVHPCPLCAPLVGMAQHEWAAIESGRDPAQKIKPTDPAKHAELKPVLHLLPDVIYGPPLHPHCDCGLDYLLISGREAQRLKLEAPRGSPQTYTDAYRRIRDSRRPKAVPEGFDPNEPRDNAGKWTKGGGLPDGEFFKRSGWQFENIQKALGIKRPKMGPTGAEATRKALAKHPAGKVIEALLSVGHPQADYDDNGFSQIGQDAYRIAIDGKFTIAELKTTADWLQEKYGGNAELRHVNQYRWIRGTVQTAKPKE